MHIHARAWRHVLGAVAIVALALPMAAPLATPASAQSAPPPASIAGAGTAAPALAFNPLGSPHTVTFTCNSTAISGSGVATTAAAAGCYNVTASVSDATSGGSSTFTSAKCGTTAADVTTATVNCSTVVSPLANGSTATVTINPGAPHVYYVNFTFYTLPGGTAAAPTCAAGGTLVSPATLRVTAAGGTSAPVTVTNACQYTVAAEKKYVEITGLTLTGTGPCAAGAGPSTVLFSEGLKTFFGTPCTITAVATGTVVLKTGVNCANGSEPANGSAVPAGFLGAGVSVTGVTYSCVGDTLSVTGIPSTAFSPNTVIPVTLTVTGLGLQNGVVSFNGACTGTAGGTIGVSAGPGGSAAFPTSVTLCPTGVGAATVQGTIASTINTQPGITSNTLTATFVAPNAARVVPYVRWAGEKAVLTKCFGGGGTFGGASIEFTLQGSPIANASLIPVTTPTSSGATGSTTSADQNTVWTVADASGCASVIVYARSEGIVNVDAAIFGTATAGLGTGAPLLNEHAFTVYYLKFDHLDLENITFPGYAIGTLTPSLAFSTTVPAGFPVASLFGTLPATYSLPNPPGTGQVAGPAPYSVPLCNSDFVRAMVHGYFEIPGDPSGRPATNVAIPGAPTGTTTTGTTTTGPTGFGSVGSYVLPAGRWVLPDDWPVLATFAGFNGTAPIQNSTPGVQDPSSVLAWDLNSGFVFNPGSERADLGLGPAGAPAKVSTGAISAANVATGPFFGQDGASQPYDTAPGLPTEPNCHAGLTVGIGPFDATQACTNPFPLTYSPAGAGVLTGTTNTTTGAVNFTFGPLGPNSTYLPNATLNQWDAPMPPAQVSFGITSGPGFLGQVNKTGLYSITLPSASSPSSAGVCPAGTVGNATPATACSVAIYPNPFYAEAIPASPLIPPITNNGGYLWNSWNFTGGTTLGVSTAGAFVPGESTTVATAFGANTCPPGFTAGVGGNCTSVSAAYTAAECAALGGVFGGTSTTLGTCAILAPNPTAATVGGLNTTNFGNCVDAFVNGALAVSPTTVTLQDATGFRPGMTVEVYSSTTGNTLAANLTVASVTGNTVTFTADSTTAALPCILAGQGVFVSQQIGITFPAGATAPAVGTTVGLFFGSHSASGTVALLPTGGNNVVYLNGAEAIVRALGGCVMSRGPVGGPVAFGTCEPATVAPAGTLITTAPGASGQTNAGGAIVAKPVNPYPFWQWVPNPASPAPARPTTATVYSDNHGEAVVSLQSGVTTTVAPVAGACPAGYLPAPTAAAPTTCLLDFATLGTTGAPGFGPFPNIVTATGAFTAAAPGCVNTTATGAATVATPVATTTTAVQVGASGAPAAGQICVNSLGKLDFGLGATLGTTTVQAVADYPYTRGDHPAIGSATLTKVWTSAFNKSVNVSSAVAGPAGTGTTTYTVTITANDLCGNPLTGEPVQVYAVGNAGAVVLAPIAGGTALSSTNALVVLGTGGAAAGTATLSLEVLNAALGNNGLLIKAVFPLEGIERFFTVVAPAPTNQTVQVIYTPGYNMVGGPSNSNFSSAEAVFSYSSSANAYSNVTASAANLSSAAPACTGYFAYFAAATAVNIPATSKPGDTAACTLHPGWNLIGNPFASPATLPTGTTAYHFNGTGYDTVGAIPVGGAVYIFNGGTADTSLTLTAS